VTLSDVLVIGAGQAGLAAGYHLKRAGLSFEIVDAGNRIGDSWRSRYASLTLFTPRAFSALPGMDMPGDPDGYPSRDEFADYLEAYTERFDIRVTLNAKVTSLGHSQQGFEAALENGRRIHASHVIIATGGFQSPIVPPLAHGFETDVLQLTAVTYRGPDQIPPGNVLVVGDGASGRDIAVELAGSRTVWLATGKPRKLFPERILGRSMWWWLTFLGLMKVPATSAIGRMMRRADPFPDRNRNLQTLRRAGVRVVPRLVQANGRTATFSDDGKAEIAAVIWTAGYRDETAWIEIPGALDPQRRFLHESGVSPVAGLYFVGRPWQRNRASALVMGAGDDAAVVVHALKARSSSIELDPTSSAERTE
jgi:putative flavoprotein involved in K+ transport